MSVVIGQRRHVRPAQRQHRLHDVLVLLDGPPEGREADRDLVLRRIADQVDRGDEEDAGRTDVLEVQVRHRGHVLLVRQQLQDGPHHPGRRGLPDQEAAVQLDEHDRHDAEQHPDQDRAERVPDRGAGDLVEHDARRGEDQTDERRRVLEEDRPHGRVGGREHVLEHLLLRLGRGAAQLPDRAEEGGALQHEGQREHDVGDERVLSRLVRAELRDPAHHRDDGPDGEEPEGGEERPDVHVLAVAVRMRPVRAPPAAPLRDQEEDLVARVGPRVRRLRRHRRRRGEQRRDGLRDGDGHVRHQGDHDGEERAARLRLLRVRHGSILAGATPRSRCRR